MSSRACSLLSVVTLLGGVLALPTYAAAQTTSQLRKTLVDAINTARASSRTCGTERMAAVAPLTPNSALTTAAQLHTAEMAARGRFSHVGVDGSQPWDRARKVGYAWQQIGENIAAGDGSATGTLRQWLGSAGHCRNLMSPRFREIGVGYAPGGPHQHVWTVVFAAR